MLYLPLIQHGRHGLIREYLTLLTASLNLKTTQIIQLHVSKTEELAVHLRQLIDLM